MEQTAEAGSIRRAGSNKAHFICQRFFQFLVQRAPKGSGRFWVLYLFMKIVGPKRMYKCLRRASTVFPSSWYWLQKGAPGDENLVRWGRGTIFREILFPGEHLNLSIDQLLREHPVDGISFVFFMGLGDYIFISPLFEKIKNTYPDLKLVALVSSTHDQNNSPLVADLLKDNTNFDDVRMYEGRRDFLSKIDWRNYDYTEAIKFVPPRHAMIPVLYEYDTLTRNRASAACEAFGLGRYPDLAPVVYVNKQSLSESRVTEFLAKLTKAVAQYPRAVIFLHLDTRSSNYSYPYKNELISKMTKAGACAVLVSSTPEKDEQDGAIVLSTKKFSINQSIIILTEIHRKYQDKCLMVCAPSVFGVVSSAENIKCLQLQHRVDPAIRSIWFRNITLLTQVDYPAIPLSKMIFAERGQYSVDSKGHVSYSPRCVMDALSKLKWL